jgi:hypothetical protein
MFDNANNKITMNKYAQVRKIEWEIANKAIFHTIVETRSGTIYYRRGVGSFRVGGMYKVKDVNELKSLLGTPDDKLPIQAKRTDDAIRVGKWQKLKDGRGYINTKTKEIVKPKK